MAAQPELRRIKPLEWEFMIRYEQVCLESFGYCLPDEIVTSDDLEQQLRPLYERLRLPEGRLELITGVRERRFWPVGALPSQPSVQSGLAAIAAAELPASHVQALIHASVCRDFLEPATACAVHHGMGLNSECLIFDLSNACLGLLNGVTQIANMIELGQIRAGLVVGTEGSRQLVETTVAELNRDTGLTRRQMKRALASLTIGSASCAVLLVHQSLSQTGNRLLGACARAHTQFHNLCHSGNDEAVGSGMQPLMETDSERLLQEGVATGAANFTDFLQGMNWSRHQIDKTFCHQVGPTHQKTMFEALGLEPMLDFSTVGWLGNIGSVALPITMAIGSERGHLRPHDKVALLGIGSGINCLMLGIEWQRALVQQATPSRPARPLPQGELV